VRYAFHGKVRGTGQVVDGYVEANNSAEAIDRLADQGIIGVHTVRPDPLPMRNTIQLAGANAQLPAPVDSDGAHSLPLAPDQVLTQLVDKLSSLVGQVEGILSRPMHFGGGAGAAPVRGSRAARPMHPSTEQNAVLKAIFQTNVDLRKSLMKLTDVSKTLQPAAAAAAAEAPKNGEEQKSPRAAAPHHEVDPAVLHDEEPPVRNVMIPHNGNGREVVSVHTGAPIDGPMHANPAA
jgi:hypothetical protein